MITNRIRSVFVAAILAGVNCMAAHGDFVHPGIAHTKESIEFVKSQIEAGEQPWASAWDEL
jgi:hypothetical protein